MRIDFIKKDASLMKLIFVGDWLMKKKGDFFNHQQHEKHI